MKIPALQRSNPDSAPPSISTTVSITGLPSFCWMYLPQLLFSVNMELFEEFQFISHTEYARLIPEKSIESEKGKIYSKGLISHGASKRMFFK